MQEVGGGGEWGIVFKEHRVGFAQYDPGPSVEERK